MPDTHTISMAGSHLTWDDVDNHANSVGFKERSKYIQYLVEKDIFKTKRDLKQTMMIIMLLLLSMMSLTILIKVI